MINVNLQFLIFPIVVDSNEINLDWLTTRMVPFILHALKKLTLILDPLWESMYKALLFNMYLCWIIPVH